MWTKPTFCCGLSPTRTGGSSSSPDRGGPTDPREGLRRCLQGGQASGDARGHQLPQGEAQHRRTLVRVFLVDGVKAAKYGTCGQLSVPASSFALDD